MANIIKDSDMFILRSMNRMLDSLPICTPPGTYVLLHKFVAAVSMRHQVNAARFHALAQVGYSADVMRFISSALEAGHLFIHAGYIVRDPAGLQFARHALKTDGIRHNQMGCMQK